MKQTRSATPAPPGKRPLLDSIRKVLPWYLFIAPASLMLLTLLAYPLIDTLRLSLFKWGGLGPQTFVGMRNFSKLFGDEIFWLALRNSFIFAIVVPFFTVSLGPLFGRGHQPPFEGLAGLPHSLLYPGDDVGRGCGHPLGQHVRVQSRPVQYRAARNRSGWLGTKLARRPQCRFDQRDDGADLAVGRISNDRVAGIHRRHSAGDA